MTLEQRVEALEKQMAAQSNGRLVVKDGEVYINEALIKDGEINAAQKQAAVSISFDDFDRERDRLLDIAVTLTCDSQYFSQL